MTKTKCTTEMSSEGRKKYFQKEVEDIIRIFGVSVKEEAKNQIVLTLDLAWLDGWHAANNTHMERT